jgi:hypothetical protein
LQAQNGSFVIVKKKEVSDVDGAKKDLEEVYGLQCVLKKKSRSKKRRLFVTKVPLSNS